ncbi:ATP-grasp domain-containing protein [Limimaricola soesokkakensis]|uniref:ATP-grasp domain-containing protein n=1 Tax=Limimaricola soesokkakensis TaxID=1343159 RepID=UPI000A26D6DB|nr:hypothetical protein [Limimaricola soesokkakensis]
MIAIHTRSGSFVTEWIAYCKERGIQYKEVDCFASDIIQQLRGCQALLWHWKHSDFRAQLFARQLIASVENMGITVFPDNSTAWHYDDKVGQKYLLEAVGAPLVETHIFYDKETAIQWIEQADFPKVWKLRGGAGSQNVQLIGSRRHARRLAKVAFSRGWRNSRFYNLRDRIWQFKRDKTLGSFVNIGRGIVRSVLPHRANSRSSRQVDYLYFQNFIPESDHDIRVVVIGKRAFAIKRMVREGDFRASGSGAIHYEPAYIPKECIEIAFDVAADMQAQSCAFDFIYSGSKWLVIEISYTFTADAYRKCPGFWDRSMNWHPASVTPERFVLEDLLDVLSNNAA